MHAASKLTTSDEVMAWRGGPPTLPVPARSGKVFVLQPHKPEELPEESLESVVRRRGSTRRFAHKPISVEDLSTLLDRATRGIAADFTDSPAAHVNDLYLNVHAVEGLSPGAYLYRWEDRELELLHEGDFREKSGYLCLEQELGGDSSGTVFFLADLPHVLERYGNRGYRAAQMEASIIGGKLYLAAYALGLGATGLTFYDDDVTEFFSPPARDKSAIFVTALGVVARRRLF
jgi:SagB-type dehydrogenase family enzyme